MIKLSGICKLKKFKSFKSDNTSNYKVITLLKNNVVICKNESDEHFCFMKDFLIVPECSDDVYSDIKILELS